MHFHYWETFMPLSFSRISGRFGNIDSAADQGAEAISSRNTGKTPETNQPAATEAGPAFKKNKPLWLQSGENQAEKQKKEDFQYTFDMQLNSFCREHDCSIEAMRKELDSLFSLRQGNAHEVGRIRPPKVDLDKPASSEIDIHQELTELLGELNEDSHHDLEARRSFISEKKYLRELDPQRNAESPKIDPMQENRLKNALDYLRNASKTERIGFIYTFTNGAVGVHAEEENWPQCGEHAGSRMDMAISGVESGEFRPASANNVEKMAFNEWVCSLASDHVRNSFNEFFNTHVSIDENANPYVRLKTEFYENNGNISPFSGKNGELVSLHLDANNIFQGVMQELEHHWSESEKMREKIAGTNELKEGQIERAFYQKSEIFNHVFTYLSGQDGQAFMKDSKRLMQDMFLMDSSHILQALEEGALVRQKDFDESRPAPLKTVGCFPVKKLLSQIYSSSQKELNDLASLLMKKLEECIKESKDMSEVRVHLEMCPDVCTFQLDSVLHEVARKHTLAPEDFIASSSVHLSKLWASTVDFHPSKLGEFVFAKVAAGHTENLRQIIDGFSKEIKKSGKYDPESLGKKLFNYKGPGKKNALNIRSLKSYFTEDKPEKTLLHAAVETHDMITITQVLSLQPPGWGLDKNGENALHLALASNDSEAALALIRELPVDALDLPNRQGKSPLLQTIGSNEIVAAALVGRGCAIDEAVRRYAEVMSEATYGSHWLLPMIQENRGIPRAITNG
jgi:hypothetical protein